MSPEQINEVAAMALQCPIPMDQMATCYGMQLDAILNDDKQRPAFFFFDASIRVEWAKEMLDVLVDFRDEAADKAAMGDSTND